MQIKIFQSLSKARNIYGTIFADEALLDCKESDTSIECAGVEIQEGELVCYDFCKGAFSCGRVAVDGYDYIGICISTRLCKIRQKYKILCKLPKMSIFVKGSSIRSG